MYKSDMGLGKFAELSKDLKGAQFGNKSLTRRYEKIVDAVMRRPAEGFPKIFRNEAALEGAYRFLGNDSVTWEKVLKPHFHATLFRCRTRREVIVIHDTTECGFKGDSQREDLGYINQTGQGFFAHCAFAITSEGERVPLGMLGVSIINRQNREKKRGARDPQRESLRWAHLVEEVEERLDNSVRAIHTMDREGDIFPLFDEMQQRGRGFVIRLCHDRVLSDQSEFAKISEALKDQPVLAEAEVIVSKRAKSTGQNQSYARGQRAAQVQYSATEVEIKRPCRAPLENSKVIKLNVVQAKEVNPPEGSEPVHWILATFPEH